MSTYYHQSCGPANAENKRCRRGNEKRNNRFDEPWSQFVPKSRKPSRRWLRYRKLREQISSDCP